jgi:restriction system protein
MTQRKDSILDDLVKAPWWVSVVCAAGAFVMLRFVVPLMIPAGPVNSSNYALKGIFGAAPVAATFVALFLLIPAPVAAFRQWRERRLLDNQEGLATIRALSWQRFEVLVAEAYRRQGYAVHRASDGGPDGGVDLLLKKDGTTLLVQCKQWKAWKVGVQVVREMYGVMIDRKAQGVIIVTSGIFTQDARTFAAGKPIDLVDGGQLAELIRAVQTTPTRVSRPGQLPPPAIPKPAAARFSEPAVALKTAPPPASSKPAAMKACPKCGAEMVLRTAQRGVCAGRQFWGCSEFPRCRATESATGSE